MMQQQKDQMPDARCQMTDTECEERQKTRQFEMETVSKAIAALSSGGVHDLLTRTLKPSFLEEHMGVQ